MRGLIGLALLAVALGACSGPGKEAPAGRRMMVVVGIDGGEWRVIERLWEEGRLPVLRGLAERGTTATLRTNYTASPVIWTTIATGVRPEVHGITDFVVPGPRGDLPVSSSVRRVPALWNMLSVAGRRVAVVGWWASWPAEAVDGVVVSDRALSEVPERFSPPQLAPRLEKWVAAARASSEPFRGNLHARRRDRLAELAGRELVSEGFDLVLIYFRTVDIVSHSHWKYFEPEGFEVGPEELARWGEEVPRAYEAVDAAIGEIARAAGPEANLLVVSDHGFRPAPREQLQLIVDFDAVLERLGYLERGPAGVRFARTRLYTYATPNHRRQKQVRFALAGREPGGTVEPSQLEELRRRLTADLARVTYLSGAPAFRVRDARGPERRAGADFVVVALPESPSETLLLDGEAFTGGVLHSGSISGIHSRSTHGILLAAGPDIRPGADLDGIRIHDIAPTLLYGLGLPVARDFAGRAWMRLYSDELRAATPLRAIASWGEATEGTAAASEVDEQLLDELRALGYLD